MSEDWLSKAQACVAALTDEVYVTDGDFGQQFPALFAFMARTVGTDGQVRQGCKVTVFAEDGKWKAGLSDPNTEHTMWVTLDSPDAVWGALDAKLRTGPEWRRWSTGRKQVGGRKKS